MWVVCRQVLFCSQEKKCCLKPCLGLNSSFKAVVCNKQSRTLFLVLLKLVNEDMRKKAKRRQVIHWFHIEKKSLSSEQNKPDFLASLKEGFFKKEKYILLVSVWLSHWLVYNIVYNLLQVISRIIYASKKKFV